MDRVKLLWSKTNRWHRVILILLIVELRLLPSRQLGFYCNDPALSHPFTGDTISWKWLLATVVFLPLVVLLIVERVYNKDDAGRSKEQALCWYKEYMYGVLINLMVVQLLKILVGEPRPDFFDTCNPQEAGTCTGSEYVSSYTCLKTHWLSQSDKSFPSGHTSLALHTGFFIAYYLHQRTKRLVRSRAILCAQVLSIVSAVYCAISRITDHRHHWWDVLAGAALGVPILFYTVASLCKNFDCPNPGKEESSHEKPGTATVTVCDT
ncbi:putative phosphatidate phosphatase [Ostrinia nubilalis]|uniref:putative phosphatidate phosphatase n=1 Tax=Ostrinia nubilalis TaxID=29057 RepID=UPI0030824E81